MLHTNDSKEWSQLLYFVNSLAVAGLMRRILWAQGVVLP